MTLSLTRFLLCVSFPFSRFSPFHRSNDDFSFLLSVTVFPIFLTQTRKWKICNSAGVYRRYLIIYVYVAISQPRNLSVHHH
jgi:hypothetical protein